MTKRAFGELELAILQILKTGQKRTVKDVHHLLGGNDKYTTIMTVMNRLVEKKQLDRERIGLQYEYWILPSETNSISFIKQLKQKLFGVKTAEMVSYLIESASDVTDEDLTEIEKIIEAAKKKRKAK